MRRLPLVWRVFLSTSLVTTGLFGLIALLVQNHLLRTTASMLDDELQASFRAYEAVWDARAESLARLSRVISGMPDVRAAFSTGDTATIRDTALEVWSRVSAADAAFFVTDPAGRVIASLGGTPPPSIDAVAAVAEHFPQQASGFWFIGERLHQVVVTPVYVDSGGGVTALINVLVAAFAVDDIVLEQLKTAAGSDLSIEVNGRTVASTASQHQDDWAILATPLENLSGRKIGQLLFMRPRTAITTRLSELRWQIAAIWVAAILFGLIITFAAARRLLEPIRQLDAAAQELRRGNYDYRVPLAGADEMGRLGEAFNAMSQSIQESRAELIRQERINTLGRIAGSVVHDLRNPLAAIYSGAEMMVDTEGMPASYMQRIASNIYRASRQVLTLLDDLMGMARGSAPATEVCRIAEIVEDAWAGSSVDAERRGITFTLTADPAAEAPVSRTRLERVFANLFVNALEALPRGGRIDARVHRDGDKVVAIISDDGPGIPASIRASLFQPFTTAGKSNGLGLGLALSRQTLLDHGGNLTLEPSDRGARFRLWLPAAARRAAA
jgi:signal transduction histidine kinase